jgi:hypothetical protein
VSITVTPETFSFVQYDNEQIRGIAEQAAKDAGLPADSEINIDVVESSPLGRIKTDDFAVGPPFKATVKIEGGAFENLKAPRQFDTERAQETLGRLFMRFADARNPEFGFEGDPDELSVPRQVAWDVYAIGRLNKLGYKVSHDRWQYLFRNRHGFTDDADVFFERLWSADGLKWPEILSESERLKPDAEISTGRRVVTR